MANTPQTTQGPSIESAFLADRQLFWHRFTRVAIGGTVGVVVLLVGMWVFIA